MDTNFQIDIEQLLQIKCPPGFGRDPIGSCSPYEFTISDTHPSIIALMKWCNLTVLYHGASNIFLTSDSIPVAYKLHARTFYGAHIFLREWDSDTYAQKQIVIPPIDRVKQDFVTDTQWFQGRELKELMLIMN